MKAQFGQDESHGVLRELINGKDSLRLVKIRLALTLITVAILPIAAVAPLVRAVLDDTRTTLSGRLAADADHAAAEVRRELNGVRGTLDRLTADADVVAAAIELAGAKAEVPADDKAAAAVAAQFRELLERPSDIVGAVALTNADGALRVRVGETTAMFAGLPPPPAGRATFTLIPDPSGARKTLEIAVGIPAGPAVAPAAPDAGSASAGTKAGPPGAPELPAGALEPSIGAVVASVPVAALIAWASPDATAAGRSVELVDAGGRVLASTGSEGGITLPGTVIDLAANSAEAGEGQALVGLPGLGEWRVIATAPLPVNELPFPGLAVLLALVLLLIAFTLWMARHIIRPAAVLEAERAKFHELYEAARVASLHDNLTGLGNHRAFQEAVGRMVDASRRYGTPFSLILLDIDEFKRINDTRGHATGDELLAEVGNLIRSTVRQADAGYRIGGDEFAILLPSTDAEGAALTTRRLLSRGLEDRAVGTYRGPISFSAGITACPQFGSSRQQLTAQADAALYRGKRNGRTLVSIFDPALDRGYVDEEMRAEISSNVAAVIESGGLSPVYQPIVHLGTGRILGYEGLVRVSPESGFRHTGALFDAAEVAGRVLELDRAALDAVLRGAHGIPAETLLSLNVSPRSFEATEFNATVLLAILRRHGVAPERVLLELTERDAIRDPERLRNTIHQLQDAGIRVAADDVGAGNAGLRLLSQFRFDVVKIDLSLVQGGAGQDQTHPVLTSLVGLARRWGALTIAEGVETAEQLRMIRQLEVDAGQGYLLGRPGAVLDADLIDLDALAGAGPSAADVAAAPGPDVAPRPARRSNHGWGPVTGSRPLTVQVPTPPSEHTAASILSGGTAPNPFAAR